MKEELDPGETSAARDEGGSALTVIQVRMNNPHQARRTLPAAFALRILGSQFWASC